MRPVVLSCLVVVFRHIHLVTAGPFPSRHPVDLLRPQYASITYGCLEGAARFGRWASSRLYGYTVYNLCIIPYSVHMKVVPANVTRSRVDR